MKTIIKTVPAPRLACLPGRVKNLRGFLNSCAGKRGVAHAPGLSLSETLPATHRQNNAADLRGLFPAALPAAATANAGHALFGGVPRIINFVASNAGHTFEPYAAARPNLATIFRPEGQA